MLQKRYWSLIKPNCTFSFRAKKLKYLLIVQYVLKICAFSFSLYFLKIPIFSFPQNVTKACILAH